MQSLKTTALDYNDANWEYYPSLTEYMQYRASELIQESKLLSKWDAKELAESIEYSLSCSQWDWVCFTDGGYMHNFTYWKQSKDFKFYISQGGRYSHQNSFEVQYSSEWYRHVYFTEKEEEKMQNLADKYTEELRSICSKLEKYWYALIEQQDEDDICQSAFERWKDINNIESSDSLYDLSYATTEQDGYTLIATDGNTSIKWLWVKLPEIVQEEKTTTCFTFA